MLTAGGPRGPTGSTGSAGPANYAATSAQSVVTSDITGLNAGTWTNFPTTSGAGLPALSLSCSLSDKVIVYANVRGTTTGTTPVIHLRIKHTKPNSSVDYSFAGIGSSQAFSYVFDNLAAGTHTFQLEYYITGTNPTFQVRPSAAPDNEGANLFAQRVAV